MFNRLYAFMAGRNGFDRLGIISLVAAIVIKNIAWFFRGWLYGVANLLALVLFGYTAFRVLSRNVAKRREENYCLIRMFDTIRVRHADHQARRAQSKQYKFFTCPSCKNNLRVPRGKGKIQITCPRCGQRFGGKT